MRLRWSATKEALRRSEERYRAFVAHSSEGIWRVELERAVPTALPEDEQVRLIFEHAFVAECNEAMARMYGCDGAPALQGARVRELLIPSDPRNHEFLRAFIRSGYRLHDAESHEVARDGGERWFLNSFEGVIREGAIARAWGTQRDITARKAIEVTLRESESRYRALVELSPDAIFIHREGRLVFANGAMLRLMGARAAGELLGGPVLDRVHPDDRELVARRIRQVRDADTPFAPIRMLRLDGSIVVVEAAATALEGTGAPAVQVVARDITERRMLEERLWRSQKLEAIGKLAGGVAHDFNNMLTVIAGHGDMLRRRFPEGDPACREIDHIRKAADKAAGLTRQLLAFSRRQVLQPKVLDLNDVVSDMEAMLRRLIGEHIDLATRLRPGLAPTRADPSQMEQVVLNLAVNARDAMPEGGRLTLETAEIDVDADFARAHPPMEPGHYVVLTLADTGCGMTPEVRAHLFEPFYTTKAPGEGTGLGLSTVYGIVKQSGGFIWAESAPGEGSTFRIYLKPAVGETVEAAAAPGPAGPLDGSETILVIEDDETVRDLVHAVLEHHGYTVLGTRGAGDALRACERFPGSIHLLLTDVVMPQANGRQVADTLVSLRPDMKILYMSGYTHEAIARHGVLEEGIAFIQKPFTPLSLARKVRDVLDAVSGAGRRASA